MTTKRNTPIAAPATKKATVQLVCRIDAALNARVRADAARAGQTLTTFVARALARAVGDTAGGARTR